MRDTRDEEGPRVPLKTILQNFLNHVESLEVRKREGDDAYEKEFQALKAYSDGLRTQSDFLCSEGEKEANRKKNRYKDILPFDYSRVLLSEYPGVPGSDYMNANYIKGASGSNAYIACQGPLPHTVNDFWRMVVEAEVQVIVMACNEQEAGKHKCERYWSEDDERQFGKYYVRLLKSREICPDFLVRTMRLRWTSDDKTEEERTVCQFHYSAWPDHGIPTQVKPLLEMVRLIRDCQASETLPVLIHCSAGCGRTGTICAIDFIWGLLRTGKLTSDFSLYNLVRDMRRQRIAMVQTVDQYILVHRAVRELFLEQMRVIDSHPYENVDDDGHPLCGKDRAEDEINPDYETVFVKNDNVEDHQKRSEMMDQILSQRMQQQQQHQPMMGTAMLQQTKVTPPTSLLSNLDSLEIEERPPQPPPKQRVNSIDSKTIENRKIDISEQSPNDEAGNSSGGQDIAAEFNKTNPNLFEPPTTIKIEAGPQKFKRGNLKLTQDERGNWKLEQPDEEGQSEQQQQSLKVTSGENNNKVRKSSPNEVKKNNKKSSKSNNNGGGGDEPIKGGELLRRPSIKKIKAFFQQQQKDNSKESDKEDFESEAIAKLPTFDVVVATGSESKSVPSSLDRKYIRHTSPSNNYSSSLDKRSQIPKPSGPREMRPQKSVSSERLVLSNTENRPLLPIKRSKSMKTIAKEDEDVNADSSFGFESNTKVAATMRNQIPPPKPKRSLTRVDYLTSSADFIDPDTIKAHLSSYKSSPNHSRQSSEDAAATRPSLNHLLMASFDLAEKEGERLILHQKATNLAASKIHSAESSPMTTMQKTSAASALFSSHSSPSNSYNRYTGQPQQQPSALPNKMAVVQNYANVSVHDGQMVALAQRKLSEASLGNKSRERRNSFREAIDNKSDEVTETSLEHEKKPYESIWFEQGGEGPIYVNTSFSNNKRASSPHVHAYESINFDQQHQQQPRKLSSEAHLQSVSLVSEVMNKKSSLDKQNSNSSLTSSVSNHSGQFLNGVLKGPPPPYVQPPQVHRTPTRGQQNKSPAPQVPKSTSTYANVQLRTRAKDSFAPLTSKDDLALNNNNNQGLLLRPKKSTMASKTNRYSCGDFSQLTTFSTPQLLMGHSHSFSDTAAGPGESPVRNISSPRHGSGDFVTDVDVDAVAATIQGQNRGSATSSNLASPQINRPLKSRAIGMISGVATNLKSRLSQLNSSPTHQSDHSSSKVSSPTQPQQSPSSSEARHSFGEQSPSLIPVTVPGADNTMPSFPYGYPERLDLRPMGARDPPAHFQRKQEYL